MRNSLVVDVYTSTGLHVARYATAHDEGFALAKSEIADGYIIGLSPNFTNIKVGFDSRLTRENTLVA